MHTATQSGRVIAGRYELVGQIGRGAMGTVWHARDLLLARDVALKEVRLPAGMTEEERKVAYRRTLREAKAAAKLNHPGVITIYDVVETDGSPWVVMELIFARSLERTLTEDGPLSPQGAAKLGRMLVAALASAHAAGIVHRDVKPANVLLTPEGRAVLTDFGIATLDGDPGLTQAGMVMGTPGFCAPERIRGEAASPASDLWSLGATLYAAVEGQGPFHRRESPLAVLADIVHSEPPVPRNAGPLAPLITALLRRDPAARPDAATVGRLLAPVASGTAASGQVSPAGPASVTGARTGAPGPGPGTLDAPGPHPGSASPSQPFQRATLPLSSPQAPAGAVPVRAAPPPAGSPSLGDAPSSAGTPDLAGTTLPVPTSFLPGAPPPGSASAEPGTPPTAGAPLGAAGRALAAPALQSAALARLRVPDHPSHRANEARTRHRPGKPLFAALAGLAIIGAGLLTGIVIAHAGRGTRTRGAHASPVHPQGAGLARQVAPTPAEAATAQQGNRSTGPAPASLSAVLPDGWQTSVQGATTYLSDAAAGATVTITRLPYRTAHPLVTAAALVRRALRAGTYPGYQPIAREPLSVRGARLGAWRFSYRDGAGVMEALMVVAQPARAPRQAYALSVTAPARAWPATRKVFGDVLRIAGPGS